MPNDKELLLPLPPYRPVPESAQRIMRTQLAVLILPAAAGAIFFGYHALKLMILAAAAAGLAEGICQRVIFSKVSAWRWDCFWHLCCRLTARGTYR